jgi:hypothetical protein
MPKVVITHNVADVATWLQYKQERADAIASLGGSNVVDHVAHDGSTSVAVSAEVADVDAILAVVSDPPPELAETMQRHGVIPPMATYVEG